MFRKNLFAQIIGILLVLILLVSVVLGGSSYWFAKKELLASGKLDLMHIANASIPILEEYNEQVQNGTLTLEEAKEKARIKLNGPKVEGNGISILTLILATLFMYLLLRKKIKALKTVTNSTIDFSNGNLEVETILYKGTDEVGKMSEAFNKMTDQLRNRIGNIQSVGKQTSHSALELSALSVETSASSEEINKAMDEITRGAVSQASDIESVNQGTENLTGLMKELTTQNGRIMELTESSKRAVGNGKNQVFSLQSANLASKGVLDNIDRSVAHLNGRVGEIASIVTTIKEIADQTNLLALNASIEAAKSRRTR